jgi:hypothetical protein
MNIVCKCQDVLIADVLIAEEDVLIADCGRRY